MKIYDNMTNRTLSPFYLFFSANILLVRRIQLTYIEKKRRNKLDGRIFLLLLYKNREFNINRKQNRDITKLDTSRPR